PAAQAIQGSPSSPAMDDKRVLAPSSVAEEQKPSDEARAIVAPSRAVAPRPFPPARAAPESSVDELASGRTRDDDFGTQGRRALAQAVPRIAAQAQDEIARVLWAAANAS